MDSLQATLESATPGNAEDIVRKVLRGSGSLGSQRSDQTGFSTAFSAFIRCCHVQTAIALAGALATLGDPQRDARLAGQAVVTACIRGIQGGARPGSVFGGGLYMRMLEVLQRGMERGTLNKGSLRILRAAPAYVTMLSPT
eukprot:jgi/Mesvir1/20458/Mv26582-RA.1